MYLAQTIASGQWLYDDAFYSSPPLVPLLLAAYGGIFGFTWQSFGALPLALTVVDAWLVAALVRRRAGDVASIAAAAAYLASFAVLATTDFLTDVHIVTTAILAALLLYEQGRPTISTANPSSPYSRAA